MNQQTSMVAAAFVALALVFILIFRADATNEGQTTVSAGLRPVVILADHDQRFTVYTGTEGPRFDVQEIAGTTVLAKQIDVVDLRRRFPHLYQLYKSAYAEAIAGGERAVLVTW